MGSDKKETKKSSGIKLFFKLVATIISWVFFVVLLIILALLIIYFVSIKIKEAKGDTSPPQFGIYVILTGSMRPLIEPGDAVVIHYEKPENLKKGDIITFMSTSSSQMGLTVTHRIIDVIKAEGKILFKTKGDANNTIDDAVVEAANVKGKVFMKIPYIGFVQQFVATKGGWLILILIPCFIIISIDLVKLVKLLSKKQQIKSQMKTKEIHHDDDMIGLDSDFFKEDRSESHSFFDDVREEKTQEREPEKFYSNDDYDFDIDIIDDDDDDDYSIYE